jgi:hypothetical protein
MEEDDEETAAAQLTAAAGADRSKSPAPMSKPASPSSGPSAVASTAPATASSAAALPPVSSFGSFHPAQYSPLLFMHPGLGMLTPSGQHFSIPFVPQMPPVHMPTQSLSKDVQAAPASSAAAPASSH